jgi:hypothetical protein
VLKTYGIYIKVIKITGKYSKAKNAGEAMPTLNKQTINIGNQSNDGTGDSIRDAFSKANNNFDILFAASGLGSGLRFTNLVDAPSSLVSQQIITTDQAGLTLTQLSIVGGTGISIGFDYANGNLTINNTASALYTDPNPYLSADLSGSSVFRAINFANPIKDQDLVTRRWLYDNFLSRNSNYVYQDSQQLSTFTTVEGSTLTHNIRLVLTGTNTSTNVGKSISIYNSTGTLTSLDLTKTAYLPSHITRKDYVDSKISLQGTETIDPLTGEINPGFGQMTGPLILSRDPVDTDSPLIAATRHYVDNNGYYSTNNLYVTMKGRDSQPDIPAYKRGRYYQYAFASINKAAQLAEALIAASKIEVGDYARLITYDDGTPCTVNSVTDNYQGSGLTRLILNAGANGSDQFGVAPVGQFTIFPGQYVQGVTSSAIGLIENIAKGTGGQEIYTIAYVDYAESFANNLSVAVPDINNPNRYVFTMVDNEMVPTPDFWVGYTFYDSNLGVTGYIQEVNSTADVNGNYVDTFTIEFGYAPYTNGQTISMNDWHIYSGSFAPNENIVYNTNVSSLQITINVESGEYYEQLPIKVPANTSVKGDEFRRVIVRPAAGVSTSKWAKTYFRRDTQIDGLQTTEINTATDYATVGILSGKSVTPNASSGLATFTLSSGTMPSTYLGYVFVGNGGRGVVTEIIGNTFVVKISNEVLLNTNTIASGSWHLYAPINFGYHYLTNPFDVNSTPKLNTEMDVFMMNDATILRYLSGQNHGGFMMVLDPEGQIKNKSPYTQTASSFSQSIDKQAFRGGMFIDGFTGNILATPTNLTNPLKLQVSGLVRRPQVPTFFTNRGIRYEVDFISNFIADPGNPGTYTATLDLNPLTPGGIRNQVSVSDSVGGFKPLQTSIPITVSAPGGIGGVKATGHAVIDGGGFVNSIVVDYPGTGYIGTPTITIGGAVINNLQINNQGHITGVGIAYGGAGYAVNCPIKFVPQNATNVYTATAVVSSVDTNGAITGINITNSGTNWDSSVSYQVQYGGAVITVPAPVSGFIDTSPTSFELITAGNRSMLANDFTQVNDLGYGIFVTNGGFAENVSMFTYYCHRSYYCLNGAQMRSVAGSSGYGNYGLCAEDSDPLEVPITVNLSYPLTQVATAYVNSPVYPAIAGQTFIYIQIDPANGGFPALGSSQIEINHNGIIKTYSIGAASQALDANNDIIPNVYLLTFNSGNLAASAQTGLLAAVNNGDSVICRAQGLNKFYGIDPASLSRPTTALVMNDDPTTVYHVTGYSSVQSDNAVFISTLENYNYIAMQAVNQGLTNPVIIDHGGGYTTATVTINTSSIKTGIIKSTNGDQGSTSSGVQSLLLDNVTDVIVGQTVSGTSITTGSVVTYVSTSTKIIGISIPTNGVVPSNTTLTFNATYPSAHAIISGGFIDQIIIDAPGTGWSSTNTAISVSGNVGSIQIQSPMKIAGVAGSRTIKISPLDQTSQNRINSGITNKAYYQFGFGGKVFNVIGYRNSTATGQGWDEIDLDLPLGEAVAKGTTLYSGLASNAGGKVYTRLSLLRVTGHDLVDIGTGGYAETRIPNDLYGPPINKPQQTKEVYERGVARVFYATTDQDGNFRVGTAFTVNQALGTVSINAPIDLTNLSTISLKRDLGPPINEFSTDNTMASEADYKVPTEQATVNYINRRLGLDRNGNVYAGAALGPQFMALSGLLAMKGAMNMGSYNITNLSAPRTGVGTDAANKSFVEQRIEIRGTAAYDTNGTTPMPQYGLMTGPLQLSGTPTTLTTVTNATTGTGSYRLTLPAIYGRYLNNQVNVAGVPNKTIISGLDFTKNQIILSNSTTGIISSGTTVSLDPVYQAATKGYVDNWLITNNNTATITNTSVSSGGGSDVTIVAAAGLTTIKLVGGLGANNPITDYHINDNARINVNKLSTSTISGVQLGNNLPTLIFGTGTFGVSYNGVSSSTIYIGQDISTTSNVTFQSITGTTLNVSTITTTDLTATNIITVNITASNLLSVSGTTSTVYGDWVLAPGSTWAATYADLAEWYSADAEYDPGTVLVFGGNAEVTTTNEINDSRVAGVVTTDPAYILNAGQQGTRACIALQGRVPVKVIGAVQKGDLLTTSNTPEYACKATNPQVGTIIGKALENKNTLGRGVIEVAIGRN